MADLEKNTKQDAHGMRVKGRKCPSCGETVDVEETVCPNCQTILTDGSIGEQREALTTMQRAENELREQNEKAAKQEIERKEKSEHTLNLLMKLVYAALILSVLMILFEFRNCLGD